MSSRCSRPAPVKNTGQTLVKTLVKALVKHWAKEVKITVGHRSAVGSRSKNWSKVVKILVKIWDAAGLLLVRVGGWGSSPSNKTKHTWSNQLVKRHTQWSNQLVKRAAPALAGRPSRAALCASPF